MKTDLKKLQNNYFEAVVRNAAQANEAIKSAQGWLLTLATTELAFTGMLIFSPTLGNYKIGCIISVNTVLFIAVAFLLSSFFSFFAGCYFQFKHLLEASRRYYKLSNDTIELMENQNITEIEKLPSFLNDEEANKLKTNHSANKYFLFSFVSIGLATIILFLTTSSFLLR